jgi:putative DNA methylase
VLLALLLPDPCDRACPEGFKKGARDALSEVRQPPKSDEDLRKALLWFIGSFANWDMAANRTYLRVARDLVKSAHPEEPPVVVDPFAGGGSIPLEALRIGCDTFASDLNPVACLILKVVLEDIPRHGPELAEQLVHVGAEIKRQAQKSLAELYPKDPDGATPIAYLWARTVRCESPNCGAEVPLMRSFWLCKKSSRRRALRHRVERPKGRGARVEFEIFEPKAEKHVSSGTVTRARARCVCCGAVLPPERVRAQLAAQRGGADVIFDAKGHRTGGARMLAVVTLKPGETGRHYRVPTDRDYQSVNKAQAHVAKTLKEWERGGKQGLCPVPDEPLPPRNTNCFRVPNYGVKQWKDLLNQRQLATASALAMTIRSRLERETGLQDLMALCLDKSIDLGNSYVRWKLDAECPVNLFARQAISMVWDYAEAVLTESSSGSFDSSVERSAHTISQCYFPTGSTAQVQVADAKRSPLPDASCQVWFTDPPYYDAIGYAELADFFFVWLKRSLVQRNALRDPFDAANPLTPKRQEIVQDERYEAEDGQPKTKMFFETAMGRAFGEGRRVLSENGVGSVVFAHKTTEGWEALLSGMIHGGWTITGSWPIATEMGSRLRARESAALATSVHLICRPRPEDAPIGDWANVLRELPRRVGDWMDRLQSEGVRGADLVFACIGPALEIFSRFSRVETAEGAEVKLPAYLEKVWEVVGRSALSQVLGTAESTARNGAAGAVEEDARLTALFLWTLQTTDSKASEEVAAGDGDDEAEDEEEEEEDDSSGKAEGYALVFDVVRRFAQPLGIDLSKWEGRVIETNKGIVRLLPVKERARQLFGEDGAQAAAARLEQDAALGITSLQGALFPEMEAGPKSQRRRSQGRKLEAKEIADENLRAVREATTLDRVHAAMLLQSAGRTNALRALLKTEQERGPDFTRLANALSALYPKDSEEKRLLDAMLLAMPR